MDWRQSPISILLGARLPGMGDSYTEGAPLEEAGGTPAIRPVGVGDASYGGTGTRLLPRALRNADDGPRVDEGEVRRCGAVRCSSG
jgi:hypothetical protein